MAFGTVHGDSLPFEKWPEAVDVDALLTVRFMTYLSQFLTEYGRATSNHIGLWGT